MKEQDAAHSFETTEWEKEEPKANGKYLVKVMLCDVPYEECEDVDEFKNGYWLRYAQFVIGWRPMPKNYKNEDEILAQQNAFQLVKALDLIDECYHYMKANPPDKTKMSYSKWQNLVEETDYMREFNADAEHGRNNGESELTRLRSELQQKDEAVLELSEILVIAYDALSVVRTEPTMSGSVLASFDKNKFIKIRGDFFEFLDKHKTLESLIKKAKLNN